MDMTSLYLLTFAELKDRTLHEINHTISNMGLIKGGALNPTLHNTTQQIPSYGVFGKLLQEDVAEAQLACAEEETTKIPRFFNERCSSTTTYAGTEVCVW